MNEEEINYLIARLQETVELLRYAPNNHMAAARLLADISALKSFYGNEAKENDQ